MGHVVSVYAHLEEVDPDIHAGQLIRAGQRVGEIGNRGTEAAANGDFDYEPELHWSCTSTICTWAPGCRPRKPVRFTPGSSPSPWDNPPPED